jgi:energy-coupling factor transporter ATP-binding protein EcfA2
MALQDKEFEQALIALVTADPRNSQKHREVVDWFDKKFKVEGRASFVTESKQAYNRPIEQFKHKNACVVFVYPDDAVLPPLEATATKNIYPELRILLFVKYSGKRFRIEKIWACAKNEIYDYFVAMEPAVEVINIPAACVMDGALQAMIESFRSALSVTHLSVRDEYLARIAASLLAKGFLLFTGLAGSGKTKIAQALACWITNAKAVKARLSIGDRLQSDRVKYVVEAADSTSVVLVQPETGTKASFPYELIDDWIRIIDEFGFSKETAAREIRDKVAVSTRFSTQQNSFESHLKAAAFHLIERSCGGTTAAAYAVVPVGADWTSNENIIGYRNALDESKYVTTPALEVVLRASADPGTPYFLILDEMNLSHVERYFSDFLSLMESDEPLALYTGGVDIPGIPRVLERFPRNLFVIGTVNVDETTYMFSPKVLDRSNAIEFRVGRDDMADFLSSPSPVNLGAVAGKGAGFGQAFVEAAGGAAELEDAERDALKSEMLEIFGLLEKSGLEYGYRTAKEVARFVHYHRRLGGAGWTIGSAIDAQICQKILPKIHGSYRKAGPVLRALGAFCREDLKADAAKAMSGSVAELDPLYEKDGEPKYKPGDANTRYPVSFDKVQRMLRRAIDDGFTSFAEA